MASSTGAGDDGAGDVGDLNVALASDGDCANDAGAGAAVGGDDDDG